MSQTRKKYSVLIILITGTLISSTQVWAENGGITLAEAVKTTLDLSPSRYIQKTQVAQAQADVKFNRGAFNVTPSAGFNVGQNSAPLVSVDYLDLSNGPYSRPLYAKVTSTAGKKVKVLQGYGPTPLNPFRYQNTDVALFHAEMNKLFRNGISASVGVLNTRIVQRNQSTVDYANENSSQVNLNINIPLLKNRGTTSASGLLNAAIKQEEAATNDYKFFLTALANSAVAAYWDYRLAMDSLEIRETSRDRVMRITQQVDQFVTDPDPRKEAKLRQELAEVIYTAQGARANRNREVIEYKQSVDAARTNFALTLGIPPDQYDTIKAPGEEIPDGTIPTQIDLKKLRSTWRKVAIENRLDLNAARQRQQAAEFILKKAKRDLYPQVDLSGSVGYQGLQEGNRFKDMWNAYGNNVNQPNWATGIEFRYPLGNMEAEGTYDSSNAQYRQAELSVYQATREIDASIDVNVGLVDRYIKAIGVAEHARRELKDALAAWKRAPLTDPSAILGMLQTENDYTESLLTILNIRTEYTKLVAEIRFNTGQLGVNGENMDEYVINFSDISKLPI